MNARALLQLSPSAWSRLNTAQPIDYPPLQQSGVQLYLKREDLLHPTISGNKLYKLHGHLQVAQQRQCQVLVSFGGYYSNHLHALAATAQALGLTSVGVVRGHQPAQLSPTLEDCRRLGMQLVFVSRRDYQRKNDPDWLAALLPKHVNVLPSQVYVIPAGGEGSAGVAGCRALVDAIDEFPGLSNTTVCVPCGTGTTLAGMLRESRSGETYLGFSALKLGSRRAAYKDDVRRLSEAATIAARWDIVDEFHCGGFGRSNAELLSFMQQFETTTGVPLDPVYTGKMLLGITALAQRGYWPAGHRVIAIHTGGLQGRRGQSGRDVQEQRAL